MMAPTHPPTSPRRPKTNHIHYAGAGASSGSNGSEGSAASGSGPQGGSGCGLSFGGAAGRSSSSDTANPFQIVVYLEMGLQSPVMRVNDLKINS